MGDFYVLCDYCLLLQHPGYAKAQEGQLAVNKGVTWSSADHAESTTSVTFSLRVKTFTAYSPPRISLHRHSYLSKTHSLADKPHLHICLVIRMRLRIWNPICLSFQHPRGSQGDPAMGEAWLKRPTPPRPSEKLHLSSRSCHHPRPPATQQRSEVCLQLNQAEPSWTKLEILESLENVLDTGHTFVANVGYRLVLWWTSIVDSFSKII